MGDYLFVSKMAYGYSKYSFPGGLVPVEGRIWEGAPTRGEVVVFRPPREPETDFIKRVIGLPGDRIQVRQGRLYINDVMVERQRIEDYVDPDDPSATRPGCRSISKRCRAASRIASSNPQGDAGGATTIRRSLSCRPTTIS